MIKGQGRAWAGASVAFAAMVLACGAGGASGPGETGSAAGVVVNTRTSNGPSGRLFELQVRAYGTGKTSWVYVSGPELARCWPGGPGQEYPTCAEPPPGP